MNNNENSIIPDVEQKAFGLIKAGDLRGLKSLSQRTDLKSIKPYDDNLLWHAVVYNKLRIAKYLLTQGLDINQIDKSGASYLHLAAKLNNYKVSRWLIRHLEEVDAKDYLGNTPLLESVFSFSGNGNIIQLLLESNANPNAKNNFGISPIDLVASKDNPDLSKLFAEITK